MPGAYDDPRKRGAFAREQDAAPTNTQGELRNYQPSLMDRARDGLNSVGGAFGYPDLAKRTGETIDLLSLPSMLALPAAPARAVAKGAGGAWDSAMARVLNRKYPDEEMVGGGHVGRAIADPYRLKKLDEAERLLGGLRGDLTAERAASKGLLNDRGAPVGPEDAKYLNELMAQRARGGFKAVK